MFAFPDSLLLSPVSKSRTLLWLVMPLMALVFAQDTSPQAATAKWGHILIPSTAAHVRTLIDWKDSTNTFPFHYASQFNSIRSIIIIIIRPQSIFAQLSHSLHRFFSHSHLSSLHTWSQGKLPLVYLHLPPTALRSTLDKVFIQCTLSLCISTVWIMQTEI